MNLVILVLLELVKVHNQNLLSNKYYLYQLSTIFYVMNIQNETKLGNEISSIINLGEIVSDNIVSNLIEKYVLNERYKIN